MNHYFQSGATLTYAFRRRQLLNLKSAIRKFQQALHEALFQDLGKSPEESTLTETGFVLAEIDFALKNLKQWMQPEKVKTNLVNFPGTSYIATEPQGLVLIIGPWNYPFNLLFAPLVGAIASGNCVVLKPSELAPTTAAVMRALILETFYPEYIDFVEGKGEVVVPELLEKHQFSHVFYTGSTTVGKEVYKMAAEQLIPVTLELGGKSPCIITSKANIRVAARRIAMVKFSNAGQICVAPDYILIHPEVKDAFVRELKAAITEFYTNDPLHSPDFGRIINTKQFDRLVGYLDSNKVIFGGERDASQKYIAPTIVDEPDINSPIMQEEIFGPLLPIISYESVNQALGLIGKNPNPLAFYVFTENRWAAKRWIQMVPSGGACINNCTVHLTNMHLPFGGRGNSGIGAYHGHFSYLCFSHRKSILYSPTWFDPSIKYPPYKGKLKMLDWVMS